jgi:hypothetical protein
MIVYVIIFKNQFMKRLIFVSIYFITTSVSYAQFFSTGFQANLGVPIGELRDVMEGSVFPEYTMSFYYKFPLKPIEVGMGVGYGKYGTELEKRNDLYPGYTDVLRLRRNNNLLTLMGILRYNFENEKKIIPFIEAQIGANHFYTRYKIRESSFEEPIEEGLDFSDWVLGFRFGGGFKIPFKNKDSGHFEFKVLYHDSGPVEYLRKQDTEYRASQGDGEFVYNPQKTTINLIQPGIGFVFFLDSAVY